MFCVPFSSVHTCLFKPVTVHLSLSICLCLSGSVDCHCPFALPLSICLCLFGSVNCLVKLSPFICIFHLSLSISLYPSVSVHLSLYNVQVYIYLCSPVSVRLSHSTCLCSPVSVHLSHSTCLCSPVSVHLSLSICLCENNISRK